MSRRIEFIEIDLPKCQNTYGVAPCTASGPASDKCYNCRSTCQDLPNLNEADEVVRYNVPSQFVRFDLEAEPNLSVPNLASVSYSPPELKLGESIGVRASLTATFKDHRSPDTDASGDLYIADRTYDPYEVGTYWGKFRARFPSLKGRALRWIVGTDDQQIADMETRHFVIDSIAGPTGDGTFKITAKDYLRLTLSDQAVAPEISGLTSITGFSTTDTGFIFDAVDASDPIVSNAPGFLVLRGEEIVGYTISPAGPTTRLINITSRGEFGTTPVANSGGDEIDYQRVASFDPQSPADILYELLTVYAGIDPAFIPLADWQNEATTQINRNYSSNIADPTGVSVLINELLQQTASTMWWDNEAQLIRWEVLKNPPVDAAEYTDQNTMEGSFTIADDYDRRVSRVYVYFGQINPLLNLDELTNYTARVLRTEIESEAFFENKPAYKTIQSRWIAGTGRETAERLGDLILQRFSLPPRKLAFQLLRDSGVDVPQLGGAYFAGDPFLQDASGARALVPFQITSLAPSNTRYTVKGEEIRFSQLITPEDPNEFNISITTTSTSGVNLRELFDQESPNPPDSDTVVTFTVASGVILGSTSTSQPAVVSGDWPAGVTITLINRGYIVGRGGNGGSGGSGTVVLPAGAQSLADPVNPPASNFTNGKNGGKGGDAFETSVDLTVENYGVIGGGGGGGGGNGASIATLFQDIFAPSWFKRYCTTGGSAGSGGAGSFSGSGGSATDVAVSGASGEWDRGTRFGTVRGGLAGSLEDGGGQAANVGESISEGSEQPINISRTHTTGAGAGGDLGQAGVDGRDGFVTQDQNDYPFSVVFDSDTSNGGNGGAAGRAVVQTGGATVTFAVTGDIRGAVV